MDFIDWNWKCVNQMAVYFREGIITLLVTQWLKALLALIMYMKSIDFFFQVMQISGSITFCSTLYIIILNSLNLYMEMYYYGMLSLKVFDRVIAIMKFK